MTHENKTETDLAKLTKKDVVLLYGELHMKTNQLQQALDAAMQRVRELGDEVSYHKREVDLIRGEQIEQIEREREARRQLAQLVDTFHSVLAGGEK